METSEEVRTLFHVVSEEDQYKYNLLDDLAEYPN